MCAVILEVLSKRLGGSEKNTNGRRQTDGRADAVNSKPLDGINGEKWVWKVDV
jgi:hypothetical protein